ncbi:MAG: type II toxin-antitoxin system HicB family antitoxin [Gemmatales bacterium]
MKLKVLVRPESGNGFIVRIPTLPGFSSHGRTVDEALSNLKQAASSWLDEAMNDLDVEVSEANESEEDAEALRQALNIKIPADKLLRLAKTHPPAASWYQEEFKRP